MTTQEFLRNSYQTEITTNIDAVDVINGSTALAFAENIFHPNGGGQPNDRGEVIIGGISYQIKNLVKKKGQTFALLDAEIPSSEELWGEEAKCVLDWQRRYHLMRFHTSGHVLMSAARQTISGYEPKGMAIQADLTFCEIKFSASETVSEQQTKRMQSIAQEAINSNLEVEAKKYQNLEAVKAEHETEFRVDSDLNLKGKIRVIVIKGFDANPCGGTHVKSLSEIGKIKIQSLAYDSKIQEASIRFMVL